MKPNNRLEILKALAEKKISREDAMLAIKNLKHGSSQAEPVTNNDSLEAAARSGISSRTAPFSTERKVAVIGMAGRFPDAKDLDKFWHNLQTGVDSVREVPGDRWDVSKHFNKDRKEPQKTYSKWAGVLEDIELFDPLFFNISPKEAAFMDPQQRLFLEECWKTIEDAGYSPESMSDTNCGVYVGAGEGDYQIRLQDEMTAPYTLSGNSSSMLSARISYLLNLKGPNLPINTACSSSLVAIHMAAQSIKTGECDTALAGGVYIHTEPEMHIRTSKAGMLSEDGKCKAFDQGANGFVQGEGVGAIMLKELSQAERDGDHIYAVISGSKTNQDGSTNGITAPSAESQRKLELSVYRDNNIDPNEISYIECHGTGTKLGDPIEIDALTAAFRDFTDRKQFCAIGSVKTNIGHSLMAAGIASSIKILLSMKHQQIAPSLHFNQPNEHIKFDKSPFFVNTKLTDWQSVNGKRIAAASSFGFSGTNAHVVFEAYEPVKKNNIEADKEVFVPVSAKSDEQLRAYVEKLADFLETNSRVSLSKLSFTLQTGRKHMEFRKGFKAKNQSELLRELRTYLASDNIASTKNNSSKDKSVIKEAVKSAITEKSLTKLSALWLLGAKVNWSEFYGKENPGKISLPTYQFEKLRCWVDRKNESVKTSVEPEKEMISPAPVLAEVHKPAAIEVNSANTTEVKAFLKGILAGILYLDEDKITDKKEFSSLGLDSVVGVELAEKINIKYQLKLEAQCVYDYPNLGELSGYISSLKVDESTESQQVVEKQEPSLEIQAEVKEFIRSRVSEILFIPAEKILDTTDFSSIGLDSVVGVELINDINNKYDLSIEAQSIYDYPNFLSFVDFVKKQLKIENISVVTSEVVQKPEELSTPTHFEKAETQDDQVIKDFLKSQISEILYLGEDKIKDELSFSSIGLDSVVGVELVNAINSKFSLSLESNCLYEHLNLKMLTAFVSSLANKNVREEQVESKAKDTIVDHSISNKPINLDNANVQIRKVKAIDSNLTNVIDRNQEGKVKLHKPDAIKSLEERAEFSLNLVKRNLIKIDNLDLQVPVTNERILDTQDRPASNPSNSNEEIELAVVGVSGRYPQAKNLTEFWKNLKNGKNCISEIPKDRWGIDSFFDSDKKVKGKSYSKWGGFISNVDKFSPLFFNISPREAVDMDPQERILLEIVWETLEDAGYTKEAINSDAVGVFIGNMINQYPLLAADREKGATILNNSNWSLANRLSFFFDFKGPSIVTNTACSSSLTAIYMACESVKRGECKYAIAGGINLNLHPSKWLNLSKSQMISSGNESQSMGNGDGYIPGEGAGTVLIKPLEDAIRDNDQIYAVVKGGSINHGGRSSGFTVPNLNGQVSLATNIFNSLKITPEEIDYIETASNGSPVGDPVELQGLINSFKGVKKKIPIGSVKSNIGHCEAASGISQFTKVLLQFKHQELAPSINSEPLNSKIDLSASPFYVQKKAEKTKHANHKTALINSFGAGGSNTQMILSAFNPVVQKRQSSPLKNLVILSAEDKNVLRNVVGNLLGYLNRAKNTTELDDLSYTLQVGRTAMEERLVFNVESVDHLKKELKTYLEGKTTTGIFQNTERISDYKTVENGKEVGLINALKANDHGHIAALWVSGYQVEWKKYYQNDLPGRISLPTYPFVRESYWVEQFDIQGSKENIPTEKVVVSTVSKHASPVAIPVKEDNSKKIVAKSFDGVSDSVSYLTNKIATLLKIPATKIESKKPFSHYGIDSILVREITELLELDFGALPKTLFFQYANIDELANYLSKKHTNKLQELSESAHPKEIEIESTLPDLASSVSGYLKNSCSQILKIPAHKMDDKKAFANYGIDSILVREITEHLEKELGALPKTMFFQCANIKELSEYLIKNHSNQLQDFFQKSGKVDLKENVAAVPVQQNHGIEKLLIAKKDLTEENVVAMQSIGGIHSKGFYLLDIWTHLYISPEKDYYIHILPEGKNLFATWYSGKKEKMADAIIHLKNLAAEQGYKMGYWSPENAQEIEGFLSTPVGTMQTIQDIPNFTIEGTKKKKLRYMVKKYQKEGLCRTEEYINPTTEIDAEIKEVIYQWTLNKKYVNSVDHAIREISDRSWKKRYRLFITYLNDQLQSIIFINKLPTGMFLLDQEYYLPEAPLGSTEFSMIEIMKQLAADGESDFTFGLTWKILDSGKGNDEEGIKFLNDLRNKETVVSQIYERGVKNFQYKMKFLPVNYDCVFYRPVDSDPEFIVEFLSLFIQRGLSHEQVKELINNESSGKIDVNPSKDEVTPVKVESTHVKVDEKSAVVQSSEEVFYDITKVSSHDISMDLLSDSWVYFRSKNVMQRLSELTERVEESFDYSTVINEVFGIEASQLTPLGRSAEKLFFLAAKKHKGLILSNSLFYTTIHHIADQGYTLKEIPNPDIFNFQSDQLFRGGLDINTLTEDLQSNSSGVTMILVELCNNSSGGYPVALQELKKIYELSRLHNVHLVLDITRILKNAVLINEYEEGQADRDLWDIVKEICSYSDSVLGSLSKDFSVDKGGIVGSNDLELINEAKYYSKLEGSFLSEIDKGIAGESFKDLSFLESSIRQQIKRTIRISAELQAIGVPLVASAKAHCILIPVRQLHGFNSKYGKETFLKKFLEHTGIRGAVHLPGNQKDTNLNECLRFCLPLGMDDAQEQMMIEGFESFFRKLNNVNAEETESIADESLPVSSHSYQNDSIAIVGLSVKYPGAANKEELWKNIEKGIDCSIEIPELRYQGMPYEDLAPALKKGGYMENVDLFDPLFFGISPKEARLMDPQQRLILEKAWEAIEDAGYTREDLSNSRTGVFIGIPHSDYRKYDLSKDSNGTTGIVSSIASNRISYTFNLNGPSEIVNTNCSSSFVALHRAIQSINSGECNEAIVGGVQVIVGLDNLQNIEALGILSSSGKSLSFDHKADGYVRSEGVGAMLVKTLSQAEKDGDHIYAVVKGTAVGHGGTGLSLTAPSAKGMKDVMIRAFEKAQVSPETVQYIEAHGISSPTPDAIELDAIRSAFESLMTDNGVSKINQACRIGAIKPCIGHSEYASGMAIITKAVMAFKHQILPGVPGFEKLNEEADLDKKIMTISNVNEKWHPGHDKNGKRLPRRAGLNSYGTGGVNAHVVMEEYVSPDMKDYLKGQNKIFVLSADNLETLVSYAEKLSKYVSTEHVDKVLAHVAYTTQIGREARTYRLAAIAPDAKALIQTLDNFVSSQKGGDNLLYQNTDESPEFEGNSPVVTGKTHNKEQLLEIANAWVHGEQVEWKKMYSGLKMYRMSLPTYPFDKKSYWTHTEAAVKEVEQTFEVVKKPNQIEVITSGSQDKLCKFMLDFISKELELEESYIKTDKPMISMGVDSIIGQKMAKELMNTFKIKVKGREMLENETIDALSAYLVKKVDKNTVNEIDDQQNEVSNPEIAALVKFKKGEISLQDKLCKFMLDFISKELELEESYIKIDKPMISMGVDSIIGQKMAKELMNSFKIKVKGREMLENETIDALSAYLAKKIDKNTVNEIDDQQNEVSNPEIAALEKFKKGEISLEEIEKLV